MATVKRPHAGTMSTAPLANLARPFQTAQKSTPDKVVLSKAEQNAFSGSGYRPASPPGSPGHGIVPQGTKKGLPT